MTTELNEIKKRLDEIENKIPTPNWEAIINETANRTIDLWLKVFWKIVETLFLAFIVGYLLSKLWGWFFG